MNLKLFGGLLFSAELVKTFIEDNKNCKKDYEGRQPGKQPKVQLCNVSVGHTSFTLQNTTISTFKEALFDTYEALL